MANPSKLLLLDLDGFCIKKESGNHVVSFAALNCSGGVMGLLGASGRLVKADDEYGGIMSGYAGLEILCVP
jgi:hypothetical protein